MAFRPTTPAELARRWARELPAGARVGVDGAVAADTAWYADHLEAALREEARPVLRTDWSAFWRPRSLRLEHGRDDPDAYLAGWLDAAGLHREVLEPLDPAAGAERAWVPSLYDPASDRSSRAAREAAPPGAVLLLTGSFLLRDEVRWGLDAVWHLRTSDAAVLRRAGEEEAGRVLGAWRLYREELAATGAGEPTGPHPPVGPRVLVLRCEDPRRPAEVLPG
ncbi:nucleoside/nucleotide kinase family protein [Kineococcus sp. SYSU DK004]|uniref:uridine kinase n=1 Tax=Kineococcus sp. SYSU DK004 TaxID=3383125 RepID=UPI003D7C415F